ncbi:hypothetical protein [Sandarakinorhabdus sp.]|uniref:hypothetical protein n=1 Tax=Sandarakinorhabdus sp. TaxID=1916663 RepID=UPI00286DC550|nr:hypothetical protein [Sandarakinorhabdus sp.]
MTARRELIIQGVLAALAAVPGLALPPLRQPNADPTSYPALKIDDLGHTKLESDATHSLYRLRLMVSGYVQGGTEAATDAALNELYGDVVRAVMVDPQLGGLCDLIDEGDLEREVSALSSRSTGAMDLMLFIEFRTRTHNPDLI